MATELVEQPTQLIEVSKTSDPELSSTEIKVYNHSLILCWWPVWLTTFTTAGLVF